MARNIEFYKELEKLNYYIYHDGQFPKPQNWHSIDEHKSKRSGMYAEAYKNDSGDIVMVIRGTDKRSIKDWYADIQLKASKVPSQSELAFQFYKKLKEKYGNVIVSGYSLGASVAQIIGNETGAETVTFAAYGVGDIVKPNHTENIINFGNELDPVFRNNLDSQIGKVYIIPSDKNVNLEKQNARYTKKIELYNLSKHYPGQIGDISKAIEHTSNKLYKDGKFNLYASYDDYDDSIFDISNKVQYVEGKKLDEMSEEEIKQKVEQYFDNGDRLPNKDEMDRRLRFGELIYVENYTRSDGTKVTGYYRRYPKD